MKIYVWSITSRFLHWVLAISFAGAYILGENEINMSWHFALGICAFSAAIFRIIWGFIGPKYSRFSDFPISPKSITEFMSSIFKKEKKNYIGHNPLASIVMIFIYIFALLSAISGMAILAKSGNGFTFLAGLPGNEELFEEMHEVITGVFLFLVFLHLLGITLDVLMHKRNSALASIFTGFKSIQGESISLNMIQKIFSLISILAIFLIFGYFISYPIIFNENEGEKKDNIENTNSIENDHNENEHNEKDKD